MGAFERFFSCVSSQMCPQSELMQTHICCICMTFSPCALSNVSLNDTSLRLHSCSSCIWKVFLLCEFSSVSSKCQTQSMQTDIGYICMAFLPCAFLNASLNYTSLRLRSCRLAFERFFSCVSFQVCPQIARVCWRILTLVAFVWLLSCVPFQMCL